MVKKKSEYLYTMEIRFKNGKTKRVPIHKEGSRTLIDNQTLHPSGLSMEQEIRLIYDDVLEVYMIPPGQE